MSFGPAWFPTFSAPSSTSRRTSSLVLPVWLGLCLASLSTPAWRWTVVGVDATSPVEPSSTPTPLVVEQCTNDQYQRCLASLESVAKGEDITLVTSKRELHHVCRTLKRVVDCVDEHTAQCFDAALQRLFNQVVAGAKETIAEVCLPGTTQEDFLRHARCNRNVTLDEAKCAPAYRKTLELAKTVSEAQDVDRGLRRSCCAFSEFVQCKSFHVSQDCGERASIFFSRHMQRISGPLIEDHCGPYAHGACTAADGGSDVAASGTTWRLLFVLVLTVARLQFP